MVDIIGRNNEIDKLNNVCNKNGSQLVVVYGRRRVGKTFLINNYFNNNFSFKLTGVNKLAKKGQLNNFLFELIRKGYEPKDNIEDWSSAFNNLRIYLDSKDSSEKQIVFFDEMPWLDSKKSGFKEAFEYFWNDYASAKNNIIFIACGSSSSWMKKYLINNKGGLFNRLTEKIYLEPFNLFETEQFLKSININWSRYEIAQCYMIMGGIPFYLNFLDSNKTLAENIDNLFFKKNATLWDEYDNLYSTLFSDNEIYKKVVEKLYTKPFGMTRDEISNSSLLKENGRLTKIMDDLESSGFVRKKIKNGNRKETLYVLTDYYTRFYLKFIKNNYGKDEKYWENSYSDSMRLSWCGNSFEQVCFDHVLQIKSALGISGVLTEEYSYKYNPKTDDESGAQIDLILDRKDNVCSICEIKYSLNEFRIDKDYYFNIINKVDVFRKNSKTRKSLQIVFITINGIIKNEYSSIANKNITIDDLFYEIRL